MTHPNTNTELPEDIRVQLDAITALADILPPRPLPGHDYTCVITPKHAEELHVRFHAIRAALAQQNEERPHGVDDGARKECRAAQCRRIRAEMQGVIDELRERVAVMESAQEE